MYSTSFLLFLLVLSFHHLLQAANITLNSSLLANPNNNSSWVSSSGDFAFGFLHLNNSNTFLLAVWYAKIPEKTIVWHAETSSPVPAGSKLQLTRSSLMLSVPSGESIWKAEINSSISYGSMLDTGNFILAGTNKDSDYVWESFSYPTDTILPGQTLLLDRMLHSKLTATNYTKGRFRLQMKDGNLVLYPVGWPGDFSYETYYNSELNASQTGYDHLFFNQSVRNLYLVTKNGTGDPLSWQVHSYSPNNYYRTTLDFDGVFRQYSRPIAIADGGQSWMTIRYIPDDLCIAGIVTSGSGPCGFNSYCTSNLDQITCSCPPGYSFLDQDNTFGGCRPNLPLGCKVETRNQEDLFELKEVPDLNWPIGDYEILRPYNQTQCHQSCLTDCLCAVAIFDGAACWKKNFPLANGRRQGGLAMIKIRKGTPPYGISNNSNKRILLWSLLFGSSGLFNIAFLILISRLVFSRRRRKVNRPLRNSNVPETNLLAFAFEELMDATGGFKEELGRGSFGIVYKGEIQLYGVRYNVAVKKLDRVSHEGEKEFKAEVSAIGRTHHKNLVQLLGFCDEGPNRLLVYEYMSNGSLANFLFGNPKPEWNRRTQVALGIARGLVYLHEDCKFPIIHCDIKPHNILIDENFVPRISDFGLAKSLMYNQTRTCTGIRGTRGYVAPEWFKNVPITVKVDVYSFGVMLFEIICRRKSLEMEFVEEEKAILTEWAYDCYMERRVDALVDEDEEAVNDINTLQRWVVIALCCIQEDPSKRPTMKTVLQVLEGYVEEPIPSLATTFSLASRQSRYISLN